MTRQLQTTPEQRAEWKRLCEALILGTTHRMMTSLEKANAILALLADFAAAWLTSPPPVTRRWRRRSRRPRHRRRIA